jgi:putative ABC transport system permease protein
MSALAFAWRSLIRQPARTSLGVIGVAAVGALLLDMLLLSNGLVLSMRDLFDRTGFNIRVTASEELPGSGPRLRSATAAADAIRQLPAVRSAVAVRFAGGIVDRADARPLFTEFHGIAGGPVRPWSVVSGRDVAGGREVVINDRVAQRVGVQPGSQLVIRASCGRGTDALPPIAFHIAGIVEFPFESPGQSVVAGTFEALDEACGENGDDEADLVLVTADGDPDSTAAAIRSIRPDLRALTNDQMLGRFQENGFTYFRQISTVLTTVTLGFALLLITVLLTVSVNQRLGELAALRALGLSARRLMADVFCESALIVGAGGLLSLPLGALLAAALDRILKRMPGIPADLHFFVFEPRALALHISLLAVTALVAASYPMRIVATLPIAATLRDEIGS